MNIPLSAWSAVPPCGGTADQAERVWVWGCGYPGRQSLCSFALGYFLLAPTRHERGERQKLLASGSPNFRISPTSHLTLKAIGNDYPSLGQHSQ